MHREFPRPRKHLGQNFLKDKEVLDRFIEACDLSSDDVVVEVGAGTGVITVELAKRVGKVIAFELDEDLVGTYLHPLSLLYPNVEVRSEDILAVSRWPLAVSRFVGAIPYQITSPLIHKLVDDFSCHTRESGYPAREKMQPELIFIVQKEVAEKITSRPPRATYLSNFVSLYGIAEIVGPPIPPAAFWPEPEVDSAILKIVPNRQLQTTNYKLQTFLHRGFKNPRKMLNKAFDPDTLKKAGIAPTLRPQNLTLDDWMRLFDILEK